MNDDDRTPGAPGRPVLLPMSPPRPKLLPIGRGRMGSLLTAMAPDAGFDAAPPLHGGNNAGGAGLTDEALKDIAVAVDFSTAGAVEDNLPQLAEAGVNVVIGTTGWNAGRDRLRKRCLDAGIGVVAAANFSVGVQYFLALALSLPQISLAGLVNHPNSSRSSKAKAMATS